MALIDWLVGTGMRITSATHLTTYEVPPRSGGDFDWLHTPAAINKHGLRVELGQHLADDLRRLMGRQRVPAFGLGDFGGKVLDGVDTADENVTQRLAAGLGIVNRSDGLGHVVVGRCGHGVHDGHGLLPTGGRRDDRAPIGVLLEVPLGEGLVVPPLARVQDAGLGRGISRSGVDRRSVGALLCLGGPTRLHGNDECAIRVANDVHDVSLAHIRGGSDPATMAGC